MSTVADAQARERAVDPHRSVAVSAPAGSGKTELLIQRILGLLATVEAPEQILAVTFTRKAAAEMAARLTLALEGAARGTEALAPHARRTRDLAQRALARDRELGWDLLDNPARLQLRTIDSLCMDLVRQLPLLSRFGGPVAVTDDAEALHREAVADLFAAYREDPAQWPELEVLLLAHDNRWDRSGELLIALLQRREQWRDYVFAYRGAGQDYLASACGDVVRDRLRQALRLLGPWRVRLDPLLAARARRLENATACVPAADSGELAAWKDLAGLLLTSQGTWRRRVNVRDGFPSRNATDKAERDAMAALLAELGDAEPLRQSLAALPSLPDPAQLGETNRLSAALCALLPRLVAHLWLCFQRRREVDYAEVSLAALEALGGDDAPTSIAQRLEYSLEHILVDEFQDTSEVQFELVRRLTRGWLEHNRANPRRPRTIMVVGDAMQSIYGFRNANVGLFLRARGEGFNGIVLEDVRLRCNFRSRPGLVSWANSVFREAFPDEDEPSLGAVRFEAAVPVREEGGAGVTLELLAFAPGESRTGRDRREAERVLVALERLLAADPSSSVAILVRARSHLQALLPLLHTRGIAFRAPELHGLAGTETVRDLMTLTRCLTDPCDRLHGYALLRSPYCGLALPELLCIRELEQATSEFFLPQVLSAAAALPALGAATRARLRRVGDALGPAWRERDRRGLRAWVENCWLRLRGAAVARAHGELQDAERFFQLLESSDSAGRRDDMPWLERQLAKLYAAAGPEHARVEIMTLHKAKGLEFDHVILPGLHRPPRAAERELLAWGELSLDDGQRRFLLAVADPACDRGASLYDLLTRERRARSARETTRLLYVAATRAREGLTLVAGLEQDDAGQWAKAPGASLLAPMEAAYLSAASLIGAHPDGAPRAEAAELPCAPQLLRLPVPAAESEHCAANTADEHRQATEEQPGAPFVYRPDRRPRERGTALHRVLAALTGRQPLPAADAPELRSLCERALYAGGATPADDPDAADWMLRHLRSVLADREHGHWLLSGEHGDSRSEWPLLVTERDGSVREYIVDRCFQCSETGDRWVVDYKTGEPARGQSGAAFCAELAERYREQLERYRGLLEALYEEPVRAALYLTAIAQWVEIPRAPAHESARQSILAQN